MTVQLTATQGARTQAHDAPVPSRKVLVLACPNARCEELFRSMRRRAAADDVSFSLVVPAIPSGMDWLADMTAGRAVAEQRLRNLVWRGRSNMLPIDSATVGDPDPLAAAMDAVHLGDFDEVVVATTRPRRGLSRLGLSLAARVHRATGLPVEHVVAAPVRHAVRGPMPQPAAANLDVALP